VRAGQNGGRGAGHADDAEQLQQTDRQTHNKLHIQSRRSRTSTLGISTVSDDPFSTISTFRDCFQLWG
jgi:hypothetical protein